MDNDKKESFGSAVTQAVTLAVIKAVAQQVMLLFVIPVVVPLVTGYIGYAQHLPWMYVLVGTALMFAGLTTGLVNFDNWREKRRVEGKLDFLRVNTAVDVEGKEVFLGISVQSRAAVPLELHVEEVRSEVDSRVPANRKFEKTEFVVSPLGSFFFNDHVIKLGDIPKKGSLSGHVDFRLRYGRLGNAKYGMRVNKGTVLTFDAAGAYVGGSWHDAA